MVSIDHWSLIDFSLSINREFLNFNNQNKQPINHQHRQSIKRMIRKKTSKIQWKLKTFHSLPANGRKLCNGGGSFGKCSLADWQAACNQWLLSPKVQWKFKFRFEPKNIIMHLHNFHIDKWKMRNEKNDSYPNQK